MWNYIKGTEADFEGAPDWCTCVVYQIGSLDFAERFENGARIYIVDEDRETILKSVNHWKIIAQRERMTEEQIRSMRIPPTFLNCRCKTIPLSPSDGLANIVQYAARKNAAVATLEGKGYTYHGGQLWKPPIGKIPDHIINDTQSLIAERGSRYGAFSDGSAIMQQLKQVMHDTPNWNNLSSSQKEALDMIQHKIGRILNGDPNYDDNWKDIAGYSTLVADELNGVKR